MPSTTEDKAPNTSIGIGAAVDEKEEERRRRKESSRRREKEDRDAKRRARESRSEVGSFHTTEDPSKRKAARSSSRRDKEDAKAKDRARSPKSHRSSTRPSTRDASDRRAKEKSRSPSRSLAPGAVSVDSSRLSSRKESSQKSKSGAPPVRRSHQDRAARERTKALSAHPEEETTLPATEHKSDPEVELVAEAVDDAEDSKFKKLKHDNEQLRQQMRRIIENNQTDAAENDNDTSLEEKPRKSRCGWYLCGFLVVAAIAAIAAGVVVFLLMQPKEDSPSTLQDESPSNSPSLAVTSAPTFSELTIQDCLAIAEGRPVRNQEDLTERQLKLKLQVSLTEKSDMGLIEKLALQEKIQQGPLLMLTGCDLAVVASGFRGSRRMAVIDSNVGDAKVVVGNVIDSCATNGASSSCFEVDVDLLIFLEAYETDTSLIQLTEFVFGQDAFSKNAGIPFGNIELVSVEPQDLSIPSPNANPTQSPVSSPSVPPSGVPTATPSLNPTRARGGDPTIAPSVSPTELSSEAPSSKPSFSPSVGPTMSPTKSPTRVPVSDPTESPTQSTGSPTKSATNSPTKSPTRAPTSNTPTSLPSTFPSLLPSSPPSASPTSGPTSAPSGGPSEIPSNTPSETPSNIPTVLPSEAPSPSPSITPGRCGPLVGGAQCSCDSEYYHCSAWGYCGYGSDEGPFYVEGEPRQYDCPSGPVSLITSSAVTSQSSTRTASNGHVMGPWKAIDGNSDGTDFFACTQTFYDATAYWQVDFGFLAEVDKITIWNIASNWYRMEGSTLELLDSNGVALSTSDMTLGVARDPASETFRFSPPVANVASAKITNTNGQPLQVCEFQAYGYIQ